MKRFLILIICFVSFVILGYFVFVKLNTLYSNGHIVWHDIAIFGVLILLALGVGIVLIIYLNRKKDNRIKWLNNRLEQWSNLSVYVNRAGDEVFSELPIGIIIYDENKEVKWVNRFAKKVFQDKLLEKTIEQVDPEIANLVNEKQEAFVLGVKGEYFDFIHRPEGRVLYFFNVTEREEIKVRYYSRIPAIGIINLDNFESETKSFDMQDKSNIRGEYLGEIAEWADKYFAFIQSYDDDSLVIALDHASLRLMVDGKFEILDKIREISANHGIRVTASMGLACWDISYEELGAYARNAIDLAEKRGGDQVVVNIQNEKVLFFGATSNAIEKNNLLAARSKTIALKETVEASSNVYIMGHINTDIDAFGAMIGTLRLAMQSIRDVWIVIDEKKIDLTVVKVYNEIMRGESDLKTHFIKIEDIADINDSSLLIIVDTQSPKIVMIDSLPERFKRLAVIDHHRSGEVTFNDLVFSYQESYASSSVELVTEMFAFYNGKEKNRLTPYEATIMLAGIVVDTNNFTFRCGSRTFEAASDLKEYGADMIEVRKLLRHDLGLQIYLAKVMGMAEVLLNNFAIVKLPENEVITDRTLLSKIADYLLNIDGVEAAFVIGCYDNGTQLLTSISARSFQRVNVQIIMEELDGGGHLNSAATQLENVSIDEAYLRLANIIKREYETGDETMKIILLQDVKGRGTKNQVIDVATGYGNYLLGNKIGILATPENLKALEEAKQKTILEEQNQIKIMQSIKADIEAKSINIYIKLGTDGKAFGQITSKQICEEFESQTGIHLDKRKVQMPGEINTVGVFNIPIQLYKDIVANIVVNVLEK